MQTAYLYSLIWFVSKIFYLLSVLILSKSYAFTFQKLQAMQLTKYSEVRILWKYCRNKSKKKTADSLWLSLFMRNKEKKSTSITPPSGLELKYIVLHITYQPSCPKVPEKKRRYKHYIKLQGISPPPHKHLTTLVLDNIYSAPWNSFVQLCLAVW